MLPHFNYSFHADNRMIGWQLNSDTRLFRVEGALSIGQIASLRHGNVSVEGEPDRAWTGTRIFDERGLEKLLESDRASIESLATSWYEDCPSYLLIPDQPLIYGLARMYGAYQGHLKHPLVICRTVEEIEDRLDLDLGWYKAAYPHPECQDQCNTCS
ncbi:MAG: hypothetical protein HUJ31_16640 [Pseudomonadales bacterium]|nr:hypothetical protein [Pseudomonadales bacterium]